MSQSQSENRRPRSRRRKRHISASRRRYKEETGRNASIDWSALEDVAAVPEGACPARDPKNRNREHRRAMRARAARVRESRGSVLRLRGGDPDLACPDFSSDRRGLLFLSWNVWGLSSGEEGDTVHSNRLAELRCVLKEADSRGERVHALGIQETWLLDKDKVEVEGYRWFGRNRRELRDRHPPRPGLAQLGKACVRAAS